MEVIQTTGSRGLDEELDRLRRRIALLEAAAPASQVIPQIVDPPIDFGSGTVTVQEADGDPYVTVNRISFDQADGYAVTVDGDDGVRIDRTAATTAPADVTTAAAAGTSTESANKDHAHKLGIITTKGDLVTYSTLPARLGVGADSQVLTADSTQATGLKWATPASAGSSKGFIPLGIKGERWLKGAASEDNSGAYGATPVFPFIIVPDISGAGVEWNVQLNDFVNATPVASLEFEFYFHVVATGGGANNCKMSVEIAQVASGGTVGGLFAWVTDGTLTFSGGAANTILMASYSLGSTILDNRALFIRFLRDSTDAYTGAFGIMKAGLKFTMD